MDFHEDMAIIINWRLEEYDICLYVENYTSYAFLNARNRKICFLRIGAVYHFFIRVPKLDLLELLEDEKLQFCRISPQYCVCLHSNSAAYTVLQCISPNCRSVNNFASSRSSSTSSFGTLEKRGIQLRCARSRSFDRAHLKVRICTSFDARAKST